MRFSDLPSWIVYRRLLAEEFGIRLRMTPVESRIEVRGHRLRTDEWFPNRDAQGTVVLIHGAGGNGRILAPLGEAIADMGWRAIAPDLPGYGLTRPAPSFDWNYAEWPKTIARLATGQSDPVVLVGLSMGGMTAVLAAKESKRVAGVIATTLLDLADDEVFDSVLRWRTLGRAARFGMKHFPAIFDRMALPLNVSTPLRAMSGNPRMQDYFVNDRLIGASRKPGRLFRTARQCGSGLIELDCPLLLAHPGSDNWTHTELSKVVFDRIQARKQFVELTNGSHMPVERPAYAELRQHISHFLSETFLANRQ